MISRKLLTGLDSGLAINIPAVESRFYGVGIGGGGTGGSVKDFFRLLKKDDFF